MSDDSLFTDEPAPEKAQDSLFTDEPAPKTAGGFAGNVIMDALHNLNPVNLVGGAANSLKEGLYDVPKAALESSVNATKGLAHMAATGETPTAEELNEAVKESPIIKQGRELTEPIAQDPLKYGYEHPVTSALTLATPVLGLMGGEAAVEEVPKPKIPPLTNSIPTAKAEEPIPFGVKETPGQPASRVPPDPNAPPPPPPKQEPTLGAALKGAIPQSVKDYIASKTQAVTEKPGFFQRAGKYLKEEANKMDAHDLGLQMRQVQKMGTGYEGLEKANALIDYARDNNYLRPGLSDIARRDEIAANMDKYGQNVGAVRKIADSRGKPDLPTMRATLEKGLTDEFGIDAPNEIQKVLSKFDKKAKDNPTFSGMSDLATELNKAKTPTKDLAQHPGPTTEGANIVSRLNNDAIRGTLNQQEKDFYTQNLRDFGAHKKLEQVTAGAARRGLTARTNQRGIFGRMFQEALDRGGYRLGSRIASGTGRAMASGMVHSLPEFFEELGHQSDEAIDDTIQNLAHGGRVPKDVRAYAARY